MSWTVFCPEHIRSFRTREGAEQFLDAIELSGKCPHDHQIEEKEEA